MNNLVSYLKLAPSLMLTRCGGTCMCAGGRGQKRLNIPDLKLQMVGAAMGLVTCAWVPDTPRYICLGKSHAQSPFCLLDVLLPI